MPGRLFGGQSISWQCLFDNERLEIKRSGIMKIIVEYEVLEGYLGVLFISLCAAEKTERKSGKE